MKTGRLVMVATFLGVASLCFAGEGEPDWMTKLAEVKLQREAISENSLWNFFNIALSNSWNAPWIHSQCWVDWLPKEPAGRVQFEQAKRDLGLDLVKAVDIEALRSLLPVRTADMWMRSLRSFPSATDTRY